MHPVDPLLELLAACVVRIDQDGQFSGTGFFVACGEVLTCAHVVHGGRPLTVTLVDGTVCSAVPITPLLDPDDPAAAFYPHPDAALLRLAHPPAHPCVRLEAAWPAVGDRFHLVGFTVGEHTADTVVRSGAALRVETLPVENGHTLVKFREGQVIGGFSGGPLLNRRNGAVAAITESTRSGTSDLGGFGVSIADIIACVDPGLLDRNAAAVSDGVWDRAVAAQAAAEAERTGRRDLLPLLDAVVAPVLGPARVVVGAIPARPGSFQPRAQLLAELEAAAERQQMAVVCALIGQRGVGKTQLAAAYARDRIERGWSLVVWVDAESPERIVAGLDAAADRLGLRREGEDAAVGIDRLVDRLRARGVDEPALVVFDNVTDSDDLGGYLPGAGATQVVVTSTHEPVRDLGETVAVEVFTPDEAVAFLGQATGLDDEAGARELGEELGRLPLELARAAAVIRSRGIGFGECAVLIRDYQLPQYLGHQAGQPYPHAASQDPHDAWAPITSDHVGAFNRVVTAAKRRSGGRFDVMADSGCGKTWLLYEIAATLHTSMGYAVLFITPRERDNTPTSPEDGLRREVAICGTLIKAMANDLAGDTRPKVRRVADGLRKASVAAASNMPLAADGPNWLINRLDTLREVLVAEVTQLQLDLDVPVAVLVDDFQWLHIGPEYPELPAGTGAEQWLRDVFGELPREVLVVCGTRPHPDGTQRGQDTTVLRLKSMSKAETKEEVRRLLSEWNSQLAEEIGSLIYDGTGGTPVWVAAYCELILAELPIDTPRETVDRWLKGDGNSGPSIEQWLPRFRNFVDDRAAGIVGKQIRLFDYLSILIRVTKPDTPAGSDSVDQKDPPLLNVLFDIGNSEAVRLYEWLRACAFMTYFDDDENLGLRMHDLIKEAAKSFNLTDANRFDRELAQERYERVEEYYRKIVHFDDELEESSTWLAWSRYEDSDWQRNSKDWLHYAGYVSNRAFEGTTEALIRLFLEVFWWWDCLVRTEYCKTLLADYRALVNARAGNHPWLKSLEEFEDNYVSGWENVPGRHAGNWRIVERALRALWRTYKLDRQPMPNAELNIRRIQIMLCMFQGDAARYRSVDGVAAATAWYAAGAAACITEDEQWIAYWGIFQQADLLVETDPDEAFRLTAHLPPLIDAVPDHELRTILTRLYADVAWGRGDVALALDIYARAILHAFVYQVRQELDRQAPSEYTAVLYQEMRTRTERRLAEATTRGLIPVVAAATSRMQAFFAPFWNEVGANPENPNGFPPGPSPEDLNELDTKYSDNVEWVIENMSTQLNEPLNSPINLGYEAHLPAR